MSRKLLASRRLPLLQVSNALSKADWGVKPSTAIRHHQQRLTSFTGQQAAESYFFVPALLHAPAPLLAKQWRTIWDKTKAAIPAATLVSSGLLGFLAYREDTSSSAFRYYLTAAVLLPSTIPYTAFLMGPINNKLVKKSENLASASISDTTAEAGVSKEETTHALVDKWASLNLLKALISGVAALSAAWATLNPVEVVSASSFGLATGANRIS